MKTGSSATNSMTGTGTLKALIYPFHSAVINCKTPYLGTTGDNYKLDALDRFIGTDLGECDQYVVPIKVCFTLKVNMLHRVTSFCVHSNFTITGLSCSMRIRIAGDRNGLK